jgi:hypothetical protein
MTEPEKKQLRTVDAPFVALGPSGVAIRDRLKHLTPEDEKVLRLVGEHLGHLASLDLKVRCADGNDHDAQRWAARKQSLTAESSSRWAGSITKSTHDQWALSRRCQLVHDRWYFNPCWQPAPAPRLSLEAALAAGCIGVDTNDDHLAAWQLDVHGNPVGEPHRFF